MNDELGLNGFEEAAGQFTEIERAVGLADRTQFTAAARRT
jgi:hypothetical protein